jgi:predicted dithiol-disulfide oxidoreductase (DUF899 family)
MSEIQFRGDGEYLNLRKDLFKAEIALRDQREKVAQLRRELPLSGVAEEYVFGEGPRDLSKNSESEFSEVKLSDLFADGKDSLIMIHLMFHPDDENPCVMCSMWADGYNAISQHVEERANFVLVAKAPIAKLRAFAMSRGWDKIRLLSSYGTSFNEDFIVENSEGLQDPAVSVFVKRSDGVYHSNTIKAGMDDALWRGIDLMSPVWHLLDLTPEGRGDWYPDHEYMG